MSVATAGAVRRSNSAAEWLSFMLQVLIAISVEVGDDLGRGLFSQHGTAQGIRNAHDIIAFEAAHGLWVEPAWQVFFEHGHQILTVGLSWAEWSKIFNSVYVFGHVGVTLGVAIWVYVYRRHYFGFFRNVIILANVFALFIYESFPVAPPRLVGMVTFDNHPFLFQDTMYGILHAGSNVVGTSTAYNEFSAMPSVHMVWAIVAGGAVIFLARPLIFRLLGLLYPCLMLVAVVVSANHFVLDAAGAMGVVVIAAIVAAWVERWKHTIDWSRFRPRQAPAAK